MAGKGQVAGGPLQASPRPGHMSNGPVPAMRLGGFGAGGDTRRPEREGRRVRAQAPE